MVEVTSPVSRDNFINVSAYTTNEFQTEILTIVQSIWAQRPADDRRDILSVEQPQQVEDIRLHTESFSLLPRLAGVLRDQNDGRTPVQDRCHA